MHASCEQGEQHIQPLKKSRLDGGKKLAGLKGGRLRDEEEIGLRGGGWIEGRRLD